MKILQFPSRDHGDVSKGLRRLADRVDAKEIGTVTSMLVIAVTDKGFKLFDLGDALPIYGKMGAYESAKMLAFAEGLE